MASSKKLIAEFFKKVKRVIIIEIDPFFETEIRAMGYKPFHRKDVIPAMYEPLRPRPSKNRSSERGTRRPKSG